MDKEILKYVEIEDLSEGARALAQVLGIDTFLEVVDYCGGGYIYIPSKGSIIKNTRNRLIKKEFDGGNHLQLATKFKLTDTQIRNILKRCKN